MKRSDVGAIAMTPSSAPEIEWRSRRELGSKQNWLKQQKISDSLGPTTILRSEHSHLSWEQITGKERMFESSKKWLCPGPKTGYDPHDTDTRDVRYTDAMLEWLPETVNP